MTSSWVRKLRPEKEKKRKLRPVSAWRLRAQAPMTEGLEVKAGVKDSCDLVTNTFLTMYRGNFVALWLDVCLYAICVLILRSLHLGIIAGGVQGTSWDARSQTQPHSRQAPYPQYFGPFGPYSAFQIGDTVGFGQQGTGTTKSSTVGSATAGRLPHGHPDFVHEGLHPISWATSPAPTHVLLEGVRKDSAGTWGDLYRWANEVSIGRNGKKREQARSWLRMERFQV